MSFCPRCGAPHEPGAKFCTGCGNALSAPNPAPQAPAPQNPVPQAPQYPQYQAPPYPQYQAPQYPQYQPVVKSPLANRSAVKKMSLFALFLIVAALVLHFLAMVVLLGMYTNMGIDFRFAPLSYIWPIIACLICAVFPLLTMLASSGKPQSGKNLFIVALLFLAVQVISVVLDLVGWVMMRNGNYGVLYTIISRITSLIAGSGLLTNLIYAVSNGIMLMIPNLLFFVSSLLFWVGSILNLAAAFKLKKS